MAISKAGDEIVCPDGHVCGTLHIDVNSGDRIELPQHKVTTQAPFSLEVHTKVDDKPDGHVCKTCGERVTRYRNATWQIRTRQGWVGDLA
jgi:hypothetical protein